MQTGHREPSEQPPNKEDHRRHRFQSVMEPTAAPRHTTHPPVQTGREHGLRPPPRQKQNSTPLSHCSRLSNTGRHVNSREEVVRQDSS